MINSTFNYLLESSICLLLFAATYKLLISNLTHFSWIRFYLLASVILSLVLPFIIIPIQWHSRVISIEPFTNVFWQLNQPDAIITGKPQLGSIQTYSGINVLLVIFYGLFLAYLVGLTFKALGFVRNLITIQKFIKQNPKEKENNYWIIRLKNEMPAFSFFNFIFINENYKNLAHTDLQLIKNHERVHVKQNHTLDILFFELVSVVFWFNPVMKYLRKSLQEVHEFFVDKEIAGKGEEKRNYAQLLLNLASDTKKFDLVASFTSENIKRRILMVAKPQTLPRYKLLFLVLVPLTAFMLLSFSYIHSSGIQEQANQQSSLKITNGNIIGEITWVGNAKYSTDTLNKLLGYNKGNDFSFDDLTEQLTEGGISNLYLDNGYLFFKADFATNQKPNRVFDITITIYEGLKAKIGAITVKGNNTVPDYEILKKITIKTGDWFSKKEIINSIRAIAAMRKFDPEKINPSLTPNQENATNEFGSVDIVFEVTENGKK